jgi:hypothetical protein
MSKKKTEVSDDIPFVSTELVEFLKENVRYVLPTPDTPLPEVYYNAGKQAVIDLLEQLSEKR